MSKFGIEFLSPHCQTECPKENIARSLYNLTGQTDKIGINIKTGNKTVSFLWAKIANKEIHSVFVHKVVSLS